MELELIALMTLSCAECLAGAASEKVIYLLGPSSIEVTQQGVGVEVQVEVVQDEHDRVVQARTRLQED